MARRKTVRPRSQEVTLMSRTALRVLSGISEHQLTLWEHEEFIVPARTAQIDGARERLYDAAALRRARIARTLADELEVNLPGIGVILNLLDQLSH